MDTVGRQLPYADFRIKPYSLRNPDEYLQVFRLQLVEAEW